MTTREKLFTADEKDGLNLGRFTPKPASDPNLVPPEIVKSVAEEGGFPSRSPTPVQVPVPVPARLKTGRTARLGARIIPRANDAFPAIVAEEGERFERGEIGHRPTLGKVVEQMLAVFIRERRKGQND
jgi:hypothetical protein